MMTKLANISRNLPNMLPIFFAKNSKFLEISFGR